MTYLIHLDGMGMMKREWWTGRDSTHTPYSLIEDLDVIPKVPREHEGKPETDKRKHQAQQNRSVAQS